MNSAVLFTDVNDKKSEILLTQVPYWHVSMVAVSIWMHNCNHSCFIHYIIAIYYSKAVTEPVLIFLVETTLEPTFHNLSSRKCH